MVFSLPDEHGEPGVNPLCVDAFLEWASLPLVTSADPGLSDSGTNVFPAQEQLNLADSLPGTMQEMDAMQKNNTKQKIAGLPVLQLFLNRRRKPVPVRSSYRGATLQKNGCVKYGGKD